MIIYLAVITRPDIMFAVSKLVKTFLGRTKLIEKWHEVCCVMYQERKLSIWSRVAVMVRLSVKRMRNTLEMMCFASLRVGLPIRVLVVVSEGVARCKALWLLRFWKRTKFRKHVRYEKRYGR